ncbi:hypothetical protein T484DRAFT_1985550 [Baffinella frigidus]|nr:hypothetical protein T484DRAFT_1985550 [Cryptophyta sp. CCMP2293]
MLACRTQLPLSWGISMTVHRSQGMTIPDLEFDVAGSFDYGQIYVGISRGASLDRVRIRNFDRREVKAHPIVKEFYANMTKYGEKFTPPKASLQPTEMSASLRGGCLKGGAERGSTSSISSPTPTRDVLDQSGGRRDGDGRGVQPSGGREPALEASDDEEEGDGPEEGGILEPMCTDDLREALGRLGLGTDGEKGKLAARLEKLRRSDAGMDQAPWCSWSGEFAGRLTAALAPPGEAGFNPQEVAMLLRRATAPAG